MVVFYRDLMKFPCSIVFLGVPGSAGKQLLQRKIYDGSVFP